MTPDKFTLVIHLGNAEMTSAHHIAESLRDIAERLEEIGHTETDIDHGIRDINGNLVGAWRFQ